MGLLVIRPLAALGALAASLFKRAPKKTVREMTLPEQPAREGGTNVARAVRRWRRAKIKRSFTRFLARKPMGAAAVGPLGASWRKGLASWRAGWAAKIANSSTVYLNRRAFKAQRLASKRRRVAAMKRLAQ